MADPAVAASLPWDEVDVLVPNDIEARALFDGGRDLSTGDLASALTRHLAVSTVVVTLGESGCVTLVAGEACRFPARETVAVGTTGASDALTATFAAYLTAGAPAAGAIHAAQSAAAQAVRRHGGHESMPLSGDGRGDGWAAVAPYNCGCQGGKRSRLARQTRQRTCQSIMVEFVALEGLSRRGWRNAGAGAAEDLLRRPRAAPPAAPGTRTTSSLTTSPAGACNAASHQHLPKASVTKSSPTPRA